MSTPLARDFSHLHVRSGFSYGYGVATPEELAGAAAGMGMRSMALTDRDGLYGVPRFLEVAGEAGVSPIVGAEVSISGGGHLVLLAEGMEGYRSLCRLITAYRCSSGDRRRPACPLETVRAETARGKRARPLAGGVRLVGRSGGHRPERPQGAPLLRGCG